jgi:plastocyanin
MRHVVPAVLSLTLLGLALMVAYAPMIDAQAVCGDAAMLQPVPVKGEPGAYRFQTPVGERVVRVQRNAATVIPDVTINVLNYSYSLPTVTITAGQTVKWHLVSGLHTVTNGTGSLDPNAGLIFDTALDLTTPDFTWTFTDAGTFPYFCWYHEVTNNMKGVVVVNPVADVGSGPVASRMGFSRPPQPNPAREMVAFSVALPRDGEVLLDVVDAAGRRVTSLYHGTLSAGDHPLRWDGRAADGRRAAPGVYRLHLRAPGIEETRAVTLLR